MMVTKIPESRWSDHRQIILSLLDRHTLKEVISIMRTQHDFIATVSQYEAKLRRWNAHKNLKMGDWVVVLSALDKLHRVGKETRVLSSGRPLPESRIKRARRYRSGKTDSQPQEPSQSLQNIVIQIKTPDGGWREEKSFHPERKDRDSDGGRDNDDDADDHQPHQHQHRHPSVGPPNSTIASTDFTAFTDVFSAPPSHSVPLSLSVPRDTIHGTISDRSPLPNKAPAPTTPETRDIVMLEQRLSTPVELGGIGDQFPSSTNMPKVYHLPSNRFLRDLEQYDPETIKIDLQLKFKDWGEADSLMSRLSLTAQHEQSTSIPRYSADLASATYDAECGLNPQQYQKAPSLFKQDRETAKNILGRFLPSALMNGFPRADDIPLAVVYDSIRPQGDSVLLSRMFANDASLVVDAFGESMLCGAVETGDIVAIKLLIEAERFGDKVSEYAREILIIAIITDNEDLVVWLIESPAVDFAKFRRRQRQSAIARDDDEGTLLQAIAATAVEQAVKSRRLNILKRLLNLRISPIFERGGFSPLRTGFFVSSREIDQGLDEFIVTCGTKDGLFDADDDYKFAELFVLTGAKIRKDHLLDLLDKSLVEEVTFGPLYRALLDQNHEAIMAGNSLENCLFWRISHKFNEENATFFLEGFLIACKRTGCGRCVDRHLRAVECALIEAAKRGQLQVVQLLLPYSSALPAVLSAAIRGRNDKVVSAVLRWEPDMTAPPHLIDELRLREDDWRDCPAGWTQRLTTPLAEAIWAKDSAMIQLLQERGADSMEILNKDGRLGVLVAAALEVDDIRYVKALLRDCPHPEPKNLSPALSISILKGLLGIFTDLLDAGANINIAYDILTHDSDRDQFFPPRAEETRKDSRFMVKTISPIVAAFRQRDRYRVEKVLNADIANSYEIEDDLFEDILRWGDLRMMKLFLITFPAFRLTSNSKSSKILQNRIKEHDAWMPFHCLQKGLLTSAAMSSLLLEAVKTGDADVVIIILDSEIDPFKEPSENLVKIAAQSSATILQLILNHKPDRRQHLRKSTEVALKAAIESRNHTMLDNILDSKLVRLNDFAFSDDETNFSSFPSAETPLHWAIQAARRDNQFTAARKLIEAGADPNRIVHKLGTETVIHHTALLDAIETKQEDLVRYLIERGADVKRAAEYGVKQTPLQKAAEMGLLTTARLLIEKGADVNAPAAYASGGTALQYAAMSGNCSLLAFLLDHGADITALPSTVNGRWPLEGAAEHGRLDMIHFLWSVNDGILEAQCVRAMALAEENRHWACRKMIKELLAPNSMQE